MKIIITEQQYNQLVKFERVDFILSENTNNTFNIINFKNKIRKLLLGGATISSIIFGINQMHLNKLEKETLIEKVKQEELIIKAKTDSLFNKKVEACRQYMQKALENQGFNEKSTKLNPESIVKMSNKYNFDLPLLIAVAHYESCFGATPRARRTNSVYSVGAYDSGKNVVSYRHPDDSIEGYIKLINNDYLINGKTLNDLLKPGGFVNKNGDRYASKKNYEKDLKYIRDKIIKQYPELI